MYYLAFKIYYITLLINYLLYIMYSLQAIEILFSGIKEKSYGFHNKAFFNGFIKFDRLIKGSLNLILFYNISISSSLSRTKSFHWFCGNISSIQLGGIETFYPLGNILISMY